MALFKKESVVLNKGSSYTSYSVEELHGLVHHINYVLGKDPDFAPDSPKKFPFAKIPIQPPAALFNCLQDGVILCKFVNCLNPDKVLIPKYHTAANMTKIHMRENAAKALEALKTIPSIQLVNVGADDITNGGISCMLGLTWQTVAYDMKRRMQELAKKNADEEKILLEWFNYHLKQAGSKTISNLSSDLHDSTKLLALLHQLNPACDTKAALAEADLTARAELMLKEAEKLNAREFINSQDVVKSNQRMMKAFLMNLYAMYPSMKSAEELEREKRERELKEEKERLGLLIAAKEKEVEEAKSAVDQDEEAGKKTEKELAEMEEKLKALEAKLQGEVQERIRLEQEQHQKKIEDARKLAEDMRALLAKTDKMEKAQEASRLTLTVNCIKLPKMDTFGLSDPFYVVHQCVNDGSVPIYQSEVIKKNLDPQFKPMEFYLSLDFLKRLDTDVIIAVWDWDMMSANDFIGQIKFKLRDAVSVGEFTTPLLNPELKKKPGEIHCVFKVTKTEEVVVGESKEWFRIAKELEEAEAKLKELETHPPVHQEAGVDENAMKEMAELRQKIGELHTQKYQLFNVLKEHQETLHRVAAEREEHLKALQALPDHV